MEKLVYLLGKNPDQPGSALRSPLIEDIVPKLKRVGAYRINVNIADLTQIVAKAAPARLMGPWDKLGAVISFWLDNLDKRSAIEPALAESSVHYAGYLVTESVVQSYQRTWKDGERRAGVTQFTALGKPAAATDEEFYHWWQIKHSESSFRLHPRRWSYIRDAVARPLTPDAPTYRALVLEHFRELEDFTDDSRYFGGEAALQEMNEETPHFCDFNNLVGGPMSEYSFA
jgi:hypothetical protein